MSAAALCSRWRCSGLSHNKPKIVKVLFGLNQTRIVARVQTKFSCNDHWKKKENISERIKKITNFSHFLHIYRCTSLYPGISLSIVWFETKLFNFYLRCDILPAENINISKLFQQYLCKSIRRPMQAPHNIRHPLWKYLFMHYNLSALNKILTNSDFCLWHKMPSFWSE